MIIQFHHKPIPEPLQTLFATWEERKSIMLLIIKLHKLIFINLRII